VRSPGEALLEVHLKELPGCTWVSEYRFCPQRRWRADFAEVERRILVEVDGGLYSGGRHLRPKGYQGDMDKLNEATRLGWRVLRFSTDDVRTGRAKAMVEAVIQRSLP